MYIRICLSEDETFVQDDPISLFKNSVQKVCAPKVPSCYSVDNGLSIKVIFDGQRSNLFQIHGRQQGI